MRRTTAAAARHCQEEMALSPRNQQGTGVILGCKMQRRPLRNPLPRKFGRGDAGCALPALLKALPGWRSPAAHPLPALGKGVEDHVQEWNSNQDSKYGRPVGAATRFLGAVACLYAGQTHGCSLVWVAGGECKVSANIVGARLECGGILRSNADAAAHYATHFAISYKESFDAHLEPSLSTWMSNRMQVTSRINELSALY